MGTLTKVASACGLSAFALLWAGQPGGTAAITSQAEPNSAQGQSSPPKQGTAEASPSRTPRGKKLVLKDGNFQMVRDYQRIDDRVRYLSAERGEWEELPASMVDWEATAKAAAAQDKESAALLDKIKAQERANQIEAPLDIDASLQVGSGVFLPPGEGMFALQGKSVIQLEQAGAGVKTDKKQLLKQILSPIPLVPGKRNVELAGAKAKVRITISTPEFFLREAPPDPDRVTPIVRSSRPGEAGPAIELVRATVKGNARRLEAIRSMFGEEIARDRNVISLQRWDVAPTVFRFTLSEQLSPGEYALAEMLPDGMNLFVWDFGVDVAAAPEKH
jgi:hypothetical protein